MFKTINAVIDEKMEEMNWSLCSDAWPMTGHKSVWKDQEWLDHIDDYQEVSLGNWFDGIDLI
jgi:hypothetical protein